MENSAAMKNFIFLFRFQDGYDPKALSPEDFKAAATKWRAWSENLARDGRMTPGQQLSMSAKVVAGSQRRVHDGPFAEGKEVVGSFCTVKARDIDEAVEIAKACPICEYEGSVEVRETVVY